MRIIGSTVPYLQQFKQNDKKKKNVQCILTIKVKQTETVENFIYKCDLRVFCKWRSQNTIIAIFYETLCCIKKKNVELGVWPEEVNNLQIKTFMANSSKT